MPYILDKVIVSCENKFELKMKVVEVYANQLRHLTENGAKYLKISGKMAIKNKIKTFNGNPIYLKNELINK